MLECKIMKMVVTLDNAGGAVRIKLQQIVEGTNKNCSCEFNEPVSN